MTLDKKLVTILRTLLEFAPALCNSLYFAKDSAQGLHIDSLYMTQRAQKHLIAAWGALEDTHEDAGQLEYFPASQLIEPMKFKDGSYHASDDEKPTWECYIDLDITWRQLTGRKSSAQKGVVFIWHANLLHDGSQIKNKALTRKPCVFQLFLNLTQKNRDRKWSLNPSPFGSTIHRRHRRRILPASFPSLRNPIWPATRILPLLYRTGIFPMGKPIMIISGKKKAVCPPVMACL